MSNNDPYRQQPPFPHPQSGAAGQPVWPPAPQPAYPQQPVYPQPVRVPFAGAPQQPQYPQPVYPPQPVAYQPQPQLPPMPAPLPLSAQPVSMPMPQPVAKPAAPRPVPVSAAPRSVPAPAPAPAKPAANRPIPAAARPILVDKSKDDGLAPKISKTESEEAPADPTQKAVKKAPPWLVSMVVHMVAIIVLALMYLPPLFTNQIEIETVWAETLGEQVLEDKLQSPESLEMQVDTPALAFDLKPVDDPLAAPPMLPDLVLDANTATDNVPAPTIGMALNGREAGAKRALLAAYGGNATTESAVIAGLEWLKRQQMADGGWSLAGPYPDGAGMENRLSATAMALLAFQGYGSTHKPNPKLAAEKKPDFHNEVRKGWDFLLKTQNPDGFFVHDAAPHHKLYAQAQGSIAICEIYGMTKDEKFKRPAQLALDYAIKAQAPEGGWRYEPRYDSDTSVTGWFVMALQSGIMAGLEVPSPNLDSINKFLDTVAKEDGSQYCYQPGRETTIVMTAEGLLCRQYLGWKHKDPRLQAGINMLLANTVNYGDQNVYYWYYATQACHHMADESWTQWNNVMKQAVPTAQTKTGNDKGSWSPSGDRWGAHGGRLYVTCLSIYMLETYYRHNFRLQ